MTKNTKTALYIIGGVGVVAVGVIGYAYATDEKRREGPKGTSVHRSPFASALDLVEISRSAAQEYRASSSGGGGAGDSGAAPTDLYDAAGGVARGESASESLRQ